MSSKLCQMQLQDKTWKGDPGRFDFFLHFQTPHLWNKNIIYGKS
jgi:hypothetical protein